MRESLPHPDADAYHAVIEEVRLTGDSETPVSRVHACARSRRGIGVLEHLPGRGWDEERGLSMLPQTGSWIRKSRTMSSYSSPPPVSRMSSMSGRPGAARRCGHWHAHPGKDPSHPPSPPFPRSAPESGVRLIRTLINPCLAQQTDPTLCCHGVAVINRWATRPCTTS